MPLSENNRQAIETLWARYTALPRHAKWFFPSSMGRALPAYGLHSAHPDRQMEQALNICTIYLKMKKPQRIQRWFFSFFNKCFAEFSNSSLVDLVRSLDALGLLTGASLQANFNAVASHKDSWSVAHALAELNSAGLLTGDSAQANFNAVVGHQDPVGVKDALHELNRAGLLTGDSAQDNRDAVAGHKDLWSVAYILAALNDAGLLTGASAQANFNAVASNQKSLHVARALAELKRTGLLTGASAQANFNAVASNQYSWDVGNVLVQLNRTGLLTGDSAQANFNAVVGHQHPGVVGGALYELNRTGLLTGDSAQANFNAVVGHQYPVGVERALHELNCAGLLTGVSAQANFNAVAGHQDPGSVARALAELNYAGLLTGNDAQTNFNAVVSHQDPGSVARALAELNHAGLLIGDSAQANRDAVAGHQDARSVVRALAELNYAGLLTGNDAQTNFNAVAGHQDPESVALALAALNRAGLLTGHSARDNRDAVVGHQDPWSAADALAALNRAGLLTGDSAQANFNALMITHSAILLHADTHHLWSRMPYNFLTQERFNAIIAVCNLYRDNVAAGRAGFIAYLAREIPGINGEQRAVPGGGAINSAQSTHTASVHESVSKSATNLNNRYGDKIKDDDLEKALNELSNWLHGQPNSSKKVEAAKRCLPRLTAEDYHFIDPDSGISTKALLALMWIAIHDEERRQSTLEDALSMLVEGLYEIQREYNLSKTGVDDGAVHDKPACPAGTFNKIVEKGAGVLPDVEIVLMNLTGFNLKFPRVVREVAMTYLKGLSREILSSLLTDIKKDNSVAAIWDEIKELITTKMFEEFAPLFQNNRDLPAFLDNIATGEYLVLSPNDVNALEQSLCSASVSSQGIFAPVEARTPCAEDGKDMTACNIS
jgi:hypothetical protein